MTIEEIINKLKEIKRQHGNLHVWSHGFKDITETNFQVINTSEHFGLMIDETRGI